MPLLGITGIGGLNLQVYVGDMAKADIEPMNVGQQRETRQPDTTGKLPEEPIASPQAKSGPVIPSNHRGLVTQEN